MEEVKKTKHAEVNYELMVSLVEVAMAKKLSKILLQLKVKESLRDAVDSRSSKSFQSFVIE